MVGSYILMARLRKKPLDVTSVSAPNGSALFTDANIWRTPYIFFSTNAMVRILASLTILIMLSR